MSPTGLNWKKDSLAVPTRVVRYLLIVREAPMRQPLTGHSGQMLMRKLFPNTLVIRNSWPAKELHN
jgi:hypothetical protein